EIVEPGAAAVVAVPPAGNGQARIPVFVESGLAGRLVRVVESAAAARTVATEAEQRGATVVAGAFGVGLFGGGVAYVERTGAGTSTSAAADARAVTRTPEASDS